MLEDLPDPSGLRVLVRADLDLPPAQLASPGQARRLRQLGPTLRWLARRGARVTICGHRVQLGHAGHSQRFARTAAALRTLYPEVEVAPDLSDKDGEGNDRSFLGTLIEGQDLYVNDTLQWCATPLISIVGPPSVLPSAAGRRLQADLELLEQFLVAPERPCVVVLGSREILDRLRGLRGLILRADTVLVGGQMAQPFLQAIGRQPPGGEPEEFIEECRGTYGLSRQVNHPVHLPLDLVWERPDASTAITGDEGAAAGSIADIGPLTRLRYSEELRGAGSILWTGSLGKVEDPRFAQGTLEVAQALAARRVRRVLGGDALLDVLELHRLLPKAVGVLSATGSAIALLKDGDLPGLAALREGVLERRSADGT